MIRVRIYGVARLSAGVSGFDADAASLHELLGMVPGIPRKEAKDLVVLGNGKAVPKHYKFKDGDEVALLAPAGGG